ncbi:MAG: hypothetical protein CVT71_00030, partial [Alphaproteobacteria bacterium HGW-Alphaproteobacteria-10]
DAFAGVFLAAWLCGAAHTDALTLAVHAGASAVAGVGAQEHGFCYAALRCEDLNVSIALKPAAD